MFRHIGKTDPQCGTVQFCFHSGRLTCSARTGFRAVTSPLLYSLPSFTFFQSDAPRRHGTSDPVTRESSDPETLFYNELQMSTYAADKRLQWAGGLPVFIAVWRLHASGK